MVDERGYLVVNPQVQGVTALVHAPSTEKARTTYLDWLERNKGVSRSLRGQLRATTITKRLDGEGDNVDYTVELDYGYENPQSHPHFLPSEGSVGQTQVSMPTELPSPEMLEPSPSQPQVEVPQPMSPQKSLTSSPIANAALNDPVAKLGRGLGT